jgi:predicted metal-dependent hydrolase
MADKIYLLPLDGIEIPIKIIIERRSSTRVALGRSHVILRIPKAILFDTNVQQHLNWATGWLRQLKARNPKVFNKYIDTNQYTTGSIFKIGGKEFVLDIRYSNKKNGVIRLLEPDTLLLELPDEEGYDRHKLIKELLIVFCQNYFLPAIIQKVNHFNSLYFKKPIQNIRLKYNKSNWGSCSTGKNLNFSVRLFFAPQDVIDYVVVHELAHLVEMNHSQRFWSIVEKIIPDYLEKEKVLKQNNEKFDF